MSNYQLLKKKLYKKKFFVLCLEKNPFVNIILLILKKSNNYKILKKISFKEINAVNKKGRFIFIIRYYDLDTDLLKKIKVPIILWIDNPIKKRIQDFFYILKKNNLLKKIRVSTFYAYKKYVPNYINFHPAPKINSKYLSSKKSGLKNSIVVFMGNKKEIKVCSIIFFIQKIINLFLCKKFLNSNNYIQDIKNNFFLNFLLKIKFINLEILHHYIKHFRRLLIKQELEKVTNLNIIYYGSALYCPVNFFKKYSFIKSKTELEKVLSKSDFTLCTSAINEDNVFNERTSASLFCGSIPILFDSAVTKKINLYNSKVFVVNYEKNSLSAALNNLSNLNFFEKKQYFNNVLYSYNLINKKILSDKKLKI